MTSILRRRGRRSSDISSCSTVVSTESDDDEFSPPRRGNDDDIIGKFSLKHFLSFDPLYFQSTSWRNQRMLSSSTNDTSEVKCIPHYGNNVQFMPGQFHYSIEELEPYRKIGDPEMDALVEHLATKTANGCGSGAFDDVIAHCTDEYSINKNTNSPAFQFYSHYYNKIPDWVDYDEIQRGIDVFLAYLPAAGCALFYRSLVGGFSIPKIAAVLVATRYLVPSETIDQSKERIDRDRRRSEERLIDTGGFLACCFAPPLTNVDNDNQQLSAASLRPGGRGWASALRVRVLHAKVRRSLLQRSNPKWDVDVNGVPINQEDMAATLLAFSVNVLLGIELASGRPLNGNDQRDYLALWRYLGWLLGVDTPEGDCSSNRVVHGKNGNHSIPIPIDPCGPTRKNRSSNSDLSFLDPENDPIIHSYATLESMILHLLHPEQSSRMLVKHLLSLRRSVIFRSEVCRKFLGDPLSDELGIPKSCAVWSGWYIESLHNFASHICVQCFLYLFLIFLRGYTLLKMTCPWFRQRAIVWHANLEGRFLQMWEKAHEGRITKVASKIAVTMNSSTKQSYCPFAMIMDPNLGSELDEETS
jgi:hypothetical protein